MINIMRQEGLIEEKRASEILRRSPVGYVPGADKTLRECIRLSEVWWAGEVRGQVACIWGLIPPTLLSEEAYLWLLTTDLVEENKFVFVRYSQLAMEAMLGLYPRIIGHVHANNTKGIQWLRWLGAKFIEPDGVKIPFYIERAEWTQ